MENNGHTYIYQIPNPTYHFSDPNGYFVAYAQEQDTGYFYSFLHYHEAAMNRFAKRFMLLYALDAFLLTDLKQIYAYTVWETMQTYDPSDSIPLLQKVKYPILSRWHEFVRTACGTVSIPREGTYKNLMKVARIYFQDKDIYEEEELVERISETLDLSEKKVRELISVAQEFRYPISLDMVMDNSTDEEGEESRAANIRSCLPQVPSADADYFRMVERKRMRRTLDVLGPKDRKLIELVSGVCTNCYTLLEERHTLNDIALILGYASESSVVKRKNKITKELRKRYLALKSQPEPPVFMETQK